MIIGVDLEKDERTLYDAYNDAAGVTARFNLNVLERINRELGGNFDLSGFIHRSIYNRDRHRIEMHLISRKAQSVRVLGHNSRSGPAKASTPRTATNTASRASRALARGAGWQVGILDRKAAMFSVHALTPNSAAGFDQRNIPARSFRVARAARVSRHGIGEPRRRRMNIGIICTALLGLMQFGLWFLRVAAASRESAQHRQ